MKKTLRLPDDFFLGAAASAWQTEGWTGKKEHQDSYIDLWYKENKDVWHNGYGPAVATDYYNRYQEDICNMKEIGMNCYRTSLNWARFLTDYENVIVDEDYAAYFDKTLDEMIAQGIEPMVCLEHYEIPGELFKKYDGFGSKHVVDLFVKYAVKAFERFGSKVKYWFAFNEPVVVQTRIHLDALRYPFYQDSKAWMQWNYNKALATNMIMKAYKEGDFRIEGGKFGTIINVESAIPRGNSPRDLEAADKYDLFYNRVFLDPAIKGCYEEGFFDLLKKHDILMDYTKEELEIIRDNTLDWVGINLYHPNRVKGKETAIHQSAPFHPNFYYDEFNLPGKKMNPHRGWEIYPKIMYDMAIRMKDQYHNFEWFVAESGMGVENEKQYKENGMIQDDYRIEFISMHLDWLLRGIEEGSNCKGYMLWAFTDNVSPMNAFKNRYGLVEIDLEDNRNRHLKKSAYFYKDLIKNRVFEVEDEENVYK
ncbi:MAG: glycoside hydrolase family 1 protein [Coprobacillus sp.]